MRLFDDDMEQSDVARDRFRGRVLHLFIGTIIANMLHLEFPKVTLTITSVVQRRNGDGPSGVLPGTGHHPSEFVGDHGTIRNT